MKRMFFNGLASPKKIFSLLVMMFFIYCFIPNIQGANQRLSYDLFSVSFPDEQQGWVSGR